MELEKLDNVPSHEAVYEILDPNVGLHAFVAVHSTELGPSAGGTRFWRYASRDEALADALLLSEGMSYKNAVADLPLGGGKGVVLRPEGAFDRPALFEAYGRALDQIGGSYITAEDVGVTPEDMRDVARGTTYVAGLPEGASASGDPSPVTALGVYWGIKACAERRFGSADLTGLRVAVQGVGHVGAFLCEHLRQAGAELVVADIDAGATARMAERFGARVVEPDAIYDADVDVFSPCALGGVLNWDTIERLTAQVVAGGANNQLAESAVGDALWERGVLYAPDFVINGGGIINVAAEVSGHYDPAWVRSKVENLSGNLGRILDLACEGDTSPHHIALTFAKDRLSSRSCDLIQA